MKRKIFFGIFVLALFLVSSCANNQMNHGMMDGGMMNKGTSNEQNAQTRAISFERTTNGLQNVQPTQSVEIADGKTYNLIAQPVVKNIQGNPIRMYGYNGQIPGPVIKVKQGSTIYVNFTNNAEFETTVHWHGLRHDNRFDGVEGVTQEAVKSGEGFLYKLSFPDAGVFWYHPHIREDLEQELGLYGNIIVEPIDAKYYNNVQKEISLFLDDIKMDGDDVYYFVPGKAIFTMMGRFGNVMLINGEENYSIIVNQGDAVRFYLTDSSNVRPFNFSIQGHKLKLIGSDLSKYEKEYFADSVAIGPGERYIAEVKFDKAGEYNMLNKIPSKIHNLGKIIVKKSNTLNSNNDFEKVIENNDVKADIRKLEKYFGKSPDYEFKLTISQNVMQGHMMEQEAIEWDESEDMSMMNMMSDMGNVDWIVEDTKTGKKNMDIDYTVKKGDIKKIKIINDKNSMHPMQHPMHLHGQRFLVLSEDGSSNNNLVWKDTVMIPAGKTVDLLVDFSNPGEWMMHCHISEHLGAGMMMVFNVV